MASLVLNYKCPFSYYIILLRLLHLIRSQSQALNNTPFGRLITGPGSGGIKSQSVHHSTIAVKVSRKWRSSLLMCAFYAEAAGLF